MQKASASDLLGWLDSGDSNDWQQQQLLDNQQSLKQLPLPVGKQTWHQRQEHSSSAQAQLQQLLQADTCYGNGTVAGCAGSRHDPAAPIEAPAGQHNRTACQCTVRLNQISSFYRGCQLHCTGKLLISTNHHCAGLAANAEMQSRRCKRPDVFERSFTSSCYATSGEKQTQAQSSVPAATTSAAAAEQQQQQQQVQQQQQLAAAAAAAAAASCCRSFAAVSARSPYVLQGGPRVTSTRLLPDITSKKATSGMQTTSSGMTYSSGIRLEQQPPAGCVKGHTGSLHLGTSCTGEDQSSMSLVAEVSQCGLRTYVDPLLLGTASDITKGGYSESAVSDASAGTAGRTGSSCVMKSSAAHAMLAQWQQEEHQQELDMAGMDNCQQVHDGPSCFSWPPRTAVAGSWCSAPVATCQQDHQRDHQRDQLLTQRGSTPHTCWTPAAAAAAAHMGPRKQLQTASAATHGQQQLQAAQLRKANKYRTQLHKRLSSLRRKNLVQKIAMKLKQASDENPRDAAAALALLKCIASEGDACRDVLPAAIAYRRGV